MFYAALVLAFLTLFPAAPALARSPQFQPVQSTQTAVAAQTSQPAQTTGDFSTAQLNASPRHHEWAEIEHKGRKVYAFVAYPEKADNATAVIVIHENRGLTDWARSFADQLAEAGYLAVAPDFLSGFSKQERRTTDFKDADAAKEAIYKLDDKQVMADLAAAQAYAAKLPGSNGKTAVIGFCWGGAKAFSFASGARDLSAALVFYGSAPEDEKVIRKISAPVYGFYGENDQRINAGIPAAEALMKKHGKTYEYEIYKGAGHAFMKHGDDPAGSPENKKARDDAWPRIKTVLAGL